MSIGATKMSRKNSLKHHNIRTFTNHVSKPSPGWTSWTWSAGSCDPSPNWYRSSQINCCGIMKKNARHGFGYKSLTVPKHDQTSERLTIYFFVYSIVRLGDSIHSFLAASKGPSRHLRLNISKADMEAPSWRLAAARLFRLSYGMRGWEPQWSISVLPSRLRKAKHQNRKFFIHGGF